MFRKMKQAAKQGATEKALTEALKPRALGDGATIRLHETGGEARATILLAEDPDIDGAGVKALEAELSALAGLPVTLVVTAHRALSQSASQPEPARIERGHNNPLGLPQDQKSESPSRARPAKQRPGCAKRVIAVASGKGGVGKSTVAARLALALNELSPGKVGLLDLDIYGPSLPVMFDLDGVRPTVDDGHVLPLEAAGLKLMSMGFLVEEDKALAWRGPMVMGASRQLLDEVRWGPLDWLVIDTPPGTGDTHLTLLQRTRIDGAIIVSTPSPLSAADMRRGAALFDKMEVPLLGLVENMAALPDGTEVFGPGLSDDTLAASNLKRLARLPLDPALSAPLGRTGPSEGQAPFRELALTLSQLDRFADAK